MTNILEHFDALTKLGLKVIPLRENSKVPLIKGWSSYWNHEIIRNKLKMFPKSNIGLLLGDIIDVEGDSEQANKTLESLIGDYPHPCYRSLRSVHHLFLTPDPDLRHFKYQQIEFRGYGHQSVLPPSRHFGIDYRWLKCFRFPIPKMPDKLLEFYEDKLKPQKSHKKYTNIWCECCKKQFSCNNTRLQLEQRVFQLLDKKWTCQNCRTIDIRPVCRKIKSSNLRKG